MSFPSNEELATREKDRGNDAFKAGDIAMAINFYTKGLQYNLDNEVLYSNRALAFIKAKMYHEAHFDATQAISINKEYVKAYHRRAVASIGLGNASESFEDYKRILELDPLNQPIKREFEDIVNQVKNAEVNENLIYDIFQNLVPNLGTKSYEEINAKMMLGTWKGATLLHFACRVNNVKAVELLLEKSNINPNIEDYKGDTPIMVAVRSHRNNMQVIKEMLHDQRVNLSIKSSDGKLLEDLGSSECLKCQSDFDSCLIKKLITDEKEKRRVLSNMKFRPSSEIKECEVKTEKYLENKSTATLKTKINANEKAVEDAEAKFNLETEEFDKLLTEMIDNQNKETTKIEEMDKRIVYLEETLANLKENKEHSNKVLENNLKEIAKLKTNHQQRELSFNSDQHRLKIEINADKQFLKIMTEKKEDSKSTFTDDSKANGEKILLDFLNESIAKLEKELECPVCMERSQIPIFQCSESHIVCSLCRPKLNKCPECRKPYAKQLKRHRYAEKDSEELNKLLKKKQTIESGNMSTNENETEKVQTLLEQSAGNSRKLSDELSENRNVEDSQQVWVGSIPFETPEYVIQNLFCRYGNVVNVKIIHPNTWRGQSYGFVSFDTTEAVNRVLKDKNKFELEGTRLVVRKKKTKKL